MAKNKVEREHNGVRYTPSGTGRMFLPNYSLDELRSLKKAADSGDMEARSKLQNARRVQEFNKIKGRKIDNFGQE